MKKYVKYTLSALLVISAAGCDRPVRTLKATEYGVKFRKLPNFLGGGVESKVSPPGQMLIVFPWEELYVINTGVREISWGGEGRTFPEYLNTRARDGNEVALAVTVRYQISDSSDDLTRLVSEVSTDNKRVDEVVTSLSRAHIRHYINELKTAEFIDPEERGKALARVKEALQEGLAKYSVNILAVSLDDFRFERMLENGQKDDTYQDKLDDVQRLVQEYAREVSRVDTVVALKSQKLNEVQAQVNRVIAEANGFSDQAKIRGDNYLLARANEAKGIRAKGFAEAEGLLEQIKALAGEGGRSLLKLDIAEQLAKKHGRFVVMNEGGSALSVNRTDTNDLLKTLGLVEGTKDKEKEKNSETQK
jgi:hypothetical protein